VADSARSVLPIHTLTFPETFRNSTLPKKKIGPSREARAEPAVLLAENCSAALLGCLANRVPLEGVRNGADV